VSWRMSVGLLARGCVSGVRGSSGASETILILCAGTIVRHLVKAAPGKLRSVSCRYPYTRASAATGPVDAEVHQVQKKPCWRETAAIGTSVLFAGDSSEAV
jgi:hypothetical protein